MKHSKLSLDPNPTIAEVLQVLKDCMADQKPLRVYEEKTLTWPADTRVGFARLLAGAVRDQIVFASYMQTNEWIESLGKKKGIKK